MGTGVGGHDEGGLQQFALPLLQVVWNARKVSYLKHGQMVYSSGMFPIQKLAVKAWQKQERSRVKGMSPSPTVPRTGRGKSLTVSWFLREFVVNGFA